MVNVRDLIWLAGYLEGEGSFTFNKRTPVLSLVTTDEDVADRVASITSWHTSGPYLYPKTNRKPFWRVQLAGAQAVGWMMTLYGFMGTRRRGQIRYVIEQWKILGTTPSSLTRNRNGFRIGGL